MTMEFEGRHVPEYQEKPRENILIVGGELNGLCAGILLLEAGNAVTIYEKPPELNSDAASPKAGAFFFPHLCEPQEEVIGYARETLRYVRDNLSDNPEITGCIPTKTVHMLATPQIGEPWYKDALDGPITKLPQDQLPPNYVDSNVFEGIVFNVPVYLNFLRDRFLEMGGIIEERKIENIQQAFEKFNTVVVSAGLGTIELLEDKETETPEDEKTHAVRGQTVVIKPVEGVEYAVFDPVKVASVVPRGKEIVLGGTDQVDDWNLDPDSEDTKNIIEKAQGMVPKLVGNTEIIKEQVGLRAVGQLHVDIQRYGPNNAVVRNGVHGGGGFSTSWGCAQKVVRLVDQLGMEKEAQNVTDPREKGVGGFTLPEHRIVFTRFPHVQVRPPLV